MPAMFTPAFLRQRFEAGLPYAEFVALGEPDGHHMQWHQRYEQLPLDASQMEIVDSFGRELNIISLTGTWCGDCALQGVALQRIADASPRINLRFLLRDPHADLMVRVPINQGYRVPVTFFCAEDFELVSRFGDRSLSRYRSIATKQLGPNCPPLGAPLPDDPVRTVLQEMLDEVERVQLLLRTSTRLREKHGD